MQPDQPTPADETERMQWEAEDLAAAAYERGKAEQADEVEDWKRRFHEQATRGDADAQQLLTLRREVARLQALLDHAEQHARDLGDGYHELELAHGRWYFLDDLGVRVMVDLVDLRRPHTVLRWKRLREAVEGWDRAAATLRDVAARTGSPAARWAADYLTADPDARRVGPWEPAPAVNAEQPEPDPAVALAKQLCEQDGCSDPAPCPDHVTAGGSALKAAANDAEPARGGTAATLPATAAEDSCDLVIPSSGRETGKRTIRLLRPFDGCGPEHTYRGACEHAVQPEDGAR
jgi:hypothetical protein